MGTLFALELARMGSYPRWHPPVLLPIHANCGRCWVPNTHSQSRLCESLFSYAEWIALRIDGANVLGRCDAGRATPLGVTELLRDRTEQPGIQIEEVAV